ncbi:hypothetical protein BGZ46_001377 [Entomortierella lignicola]|nr:hypothetical protein BGZ46_001377 [Entomortierella lignicola]
MHTSLFAREQPVAPLAITKIEGMEKLRQTILGLEVVTPLSINEYLSPDEEQFTVHYEFSDAKLLVGPIFTEEDAEEDIESEEDKPLMEIFRNGPINNQNRLTMQDNGLFATYDAAGKLIGVVSSNGIKSFPFPIQPACTGPTLS